MHDGTGDTGERAARFGAGLTELIAEKGRSIDAVAASALIDPKTLHAYLEQRGGKPRVADMARLCLALDLDPLDFLHRTGFLTDVDYAMGLDPLFFLVEGGVRAMMRITLRERQNNPMQIEGEHVIRRNAVIRALQDDLLVDASGRIELQMRYLLLAAKNAGWMEAP